MILNIAVFYKQNGSKWNLFIVYSDLILASSSQSLGWIPPLVDHTTLQSSTDLSQRIFTVEVGWANYQFKRNHPNDEPSPVGSETFNQQLIQRPRLPHLRLLGWGEAGAMAGMSRDGAMAGGMSREGAMAGGADMRGIVGAGMGWETWPRCKFKQRKVVGIYYLDSCSDHFC